MTRALLALLLWMWPAATAHAQSTDIASLERAVAANPADARIRQRLADGYLSAARSMDAVAQLRQATALAPRNPQVWYALGQAYNAVKQDALETFREPSDAPWRE